MFKHPVRFTLLDLLTFSALLPIGIGCVGAFRITATYVEIIVLDDPIREINQAIADKMLASPGFLGTLFYATLLIALGNLIGWVLCLLLIVLLAFFRSIIARMLAAAVLAGVPVVDVILALPLDDQTLSLLSARLISSTTASIMLIAIFIAMCRLSPISTKLGGKLREKASAFRWIFVILVAVLVIVSSFGWRALYQYLH